MLVTSSVKTGDKPTKEQINRIRKAAKQPITFDEDCPESTPEQLAFFAAEARKRNLKQTVNNPELLKKAL
jgi:hypothetical protein